MMDIITLLYTQPTTQAIYNYVKPIASVLTLSLLSIFITRRYLSQGFTYLLKKTNITLIDLRIQKRVFSRLSYITPAIIINLSVSWLIPECIKSQIILKQVSLSYIILMGLLAANTAITIIETLLKKHKEIKKLPVRSYIQVIKLLLSTFCSILIITTLINKSPWTLLSGLGAMTAILSLIFKDSILGLISSIQLSINQLVRPGDWIEIPKHNIDGDVIEVSLNTVKIQNWDKTISSIPTHLLTTDSFKNWRGMSDSGGRRIKRSLHIDMASIKFADTSLLKKLEAIRILAPIIQNKKEGITAYNQEKNVSPDSLSLNGRHLTNIGLFRYYIEAYLKQNLKLNTTTMTCLVRQLQPKETGLPIEIYTFTSDTNWNHYESIQADIFDHLLAIITIFDLNVFQATSGKDIRSLQSS